MIAISAMFALSADGKIACRGHAGSGFGSPADKARMLEARAAADAVLVGRATLEADRMSLALGDRIDLADTREQSGRSRFPARLVACGSRRPPPDHPVFHRPGGPLHLLDGHHVVAELQSLATREGWQTIHCEGGPRLLATLASADLLTTLHITLCPLLFGGASAPRLLPQLADWPHSQDWSLATIDRVGDEAFLTYHRQ